MGQTIEQIIIQLKLQSKGALRSLTTLNKTFKKNGQLTKSAENSLKKLSASQGALGKITKSTQKQFAGWALSMMFFGMAIQKVFKGIMDSGVKAFQEVMHSVEGTITPFDLLSASIQTISFSIGQAISSFLEPYIGTIMEMIDKLAEFISNNKQLVAILILVGLALGTLMMTFGMVKLGVDGLITASGILSTTWTSMSTALSAATGVMGVSVLGFFAIIAVAIVVFIVMWKTNFGKIRDFFNDTFSAMKATFKSVWNNVKEIFVNVWGFITSMFTGEWDIALGYLIKALANALSLVIKLLSNAGVLIVNVFVFAINLISSLFFTQVKGMLSLINIVAKELDKVFGTNLSSEVEKALALAKSVQSSLTVDYISGETMEPILSSIDETLGLGEGGTITNINNNYEVGETIVEDANRTRNVA